MTEQQHVECQYRAIFEGTGDGILVTSLESGLIADANPAMCRMAGYTRAELIGMHPTNIIHPSSWPLYWERLKGHEMNAEDDRVPLVGVHRDGSQRHVEVQVQTVDLGGYLARLSVVRDVTERVRAVELLEQRVHERTRELSAILELTQAVNGTLELEPLLGLVLDRLGTIVDYSEAVIMLLDGDELCISDYRGSLLRQQVVGRRTSATHAVVFQEVVRRDGPVIVNNMQGDEPVAVAYRQWTERQEFDPLLPPQSVLAVPLKNSGEVIGQLRLDHDQPGYYQGRHADLALVFANQTATAIVNARLFEAERQTRENLELALEAGQMGIWDWDIASGRVTWSPQLEVIRGLAPGDFSQTFEATFRDIHADDVQRVKQTINESLEQDTHHIEYRILRPDGQLRWLESRGRVVRDADETPRGMRGVCMDITARKEAEEERNRLIAREQAAIEAKGALEERQKLARELHDSVSQSLYGIGTAAQTARSALEDDHDTAAATEALSYVVTMADMGLAEMRALISELRPETLAQEGLVAALERHVELVRARQHLRVETDLGQEPQLALAAKEALYRIALEALHNTVKHARAHSVSMSLRSTEETTLLEMTDDGVGFDPAGEYPGHLGLASMAERARAAGGQLRIDSDAEHGTRVTVQIPSNSYAEELVSSV